MQKVSWRNITHICVETLEKSKIATESLETLRSLEELERDFESFYREKLKNEEVAQEIRIKIKDNKGRSQDFDESERELREDFCWLADAVFGMFIMVDRVRVEVY